MAGWYFPELPSRQIAQMGDVDDNPVHMCAEEEFWTVAKVAFLWGRSNGTSGEHPKGLALDFSVLEYGGGVNDPGPARYWMGNKIANWFVANRARTGTWYIIWNRQIFSSNRYSYAYNRWVPYRGSNPHTDHVHVSFYAADIYQPPAIDKPVEPEDELTPEDRQWIAGEIAAARDTMIAKAASAIQASEQRLVAEIRNRSSAAIKQVDADTLGYGGKTFWKEGYFSADASRNTRVLLRMLAEHFDRVEELHPPDTDVPEGPEPTGSDEAQS